MFKKVFAILVTALCALAFCLMGGVDKAEAQTYTGRWYPAPITNDGWVYLQPRIDVKIDYNPGDSTMQVSFHNAGLNYAGTSKTTSSHFCDAVVLMRPPASGRTEMNVTSTTDTLAKSEQHARQWAGDRLVYGATQNAGTSWPNAQVADFGPITDGAWHTYTYDVSGYSPGDSPLILCLGNRWYEGNAKLEWQQSLYADTLGMDIKIAPKVTASSGTGGSISPSGTKAYTYGTNSDTYTWTRNYGYALKDVKVDGISQGKISSYRFSNLTSDHTISVEWQPLGIVAVNKRTADTSLSITNRYSLQGAQYTLYTNSNCTSIAKDVEGNNIILTTDTQGKASTAKVVYDGTYYLKETKASTGYRLDTIVHTVTISNGSTCTITSSEPPQRGYISVHKTSAAPSWTTGNKCYSLAGATYGVYRDGVQVTTLTTDANGNTNTFTAPLGNYTVKELTPSTGYRLDMTTYSIDIATDNQSKTFESIENPLIDIYPLKLHKMDADAEKTGHADTAQGGLSLAGAKYSIKYYDGYYTSVLQTAPLTPKWEKTYTTAIDENNQATFTVPDADKYTDGTDAVGWMLGTYVIEEIEAPFGYNLDDADPYITQITKATATTAESNISTGRSDGDTGTLITDSNALLSSDVLKRADLMIMKYGEPSTDTDENPSQKPGQESVKFEIINNNENDVYRVDTGTWAAKGEVVYTITTDEQGYANTQDIALKHGLDHALACGNYIVHEVPESTHPGYAPMADAELSVTTPLKTYRWVIENKIGTAIKISKHDEGTGNIVRGNSSFEILDESGKPVTMSLQYPAGATVSVFTTGIDGTVTLPEKLMPGSYKIREVKAPEGYRISDELVPFTIDSSTVNTWDTPLVTGYSDEPAMGVIEVINVDAETQQRITGTSSVIEIYADEDIVTNDGTVRAKKGELVYTGTTSAGTFDTPEFHLGRYRIVQKIAPEGYVLNETSYTVDIPYQGDSVPTVHAEAEVPNSPQKGNAQITVIDKESGLPILVPGASYNFVAREDIVTPDGTVRYHKGDVIETITTDEEGHAKTENGHYIGKYEFVQTVAPEGYVGDETPISVDIIYTNQDSDVAASVPVEHALTPQKGHVAVEKLDTETGLPVLVAGAKFSLYAAEDIATGDGSVHCRKGDKIADITTDDTGRGVTDETLYLGTYIVKENAAPFGYANDKNQKIEVVLSYAGQDKELTDTGMGGVYVRNVPMKGSAEVQKLDAETGRPLAMPGIEIEIRAKEDIVTGDGTIRFHAGDTVMTVITGEDGLSIAEELYTGKYEAIEKTAPNGYHVNPNPVPFEIEYIDGDTDPKPPHVEISDAPVKGVIEIAKMDAESGNTLVHSPATFEIRAAEDIVTADGTVRVKKGVTVEEVLSTVDGKATSGELYPGKYVVIETAAPYGYILDSTEHEVVLGTDCGSDEIAHAKMSVPNSVQKSSIEIQKIDDESKLPVPRPGIVFDIVADEDITTPDGDVKHKKGDIIATIETDDVGKAKIDDLYVGKYVIIEKIPADGYELNSKPVAIETKYGEEAVLDIMAEHPGIMARGNVSVSKMDGYNKKDMLEGAVFELRAREDIIGGDGVTVYHEAGDVIAEGETGTDGKLVFEHVRQGEYTIVEVEAPAGYLMAADKDVTVWYNWVKENVIEIDSADGDNESNGNDGDVEPVLSLSKSFTALADNEGAAADEDADGDTGEETDDMDGAGMRDLVDVEVAIYDMPIQVSALKIDEEGEMLDDCDLQLYRENKTSSAEGNVNEDSNGEITNGEDNDDADNKNESDDKTSADESSKQKDKSTSNGNDSDDGEMELIAEWTTSNMQSKLLSAIPEGTYILHEERAKDGYELTEDVEFEVRAKDAENGAIEVVMIDKKSEVAAEIIEIDGEPAPKEQFIEMVQTGDSIVLAVGSGLIVSLAGLGVIVWKRRRNH